MADIKANIKIITFRLDNAETSKKLASFNIYGHTGKSKFQKANTLLACFFNRRERIAKGKYRIY